MQVQLKGKRVAVEKTKKQANKVHGGLIVPDSEEYLGFVKLVGESADTSIKVGQKVYFSTKFQTCRIAGMDLCVMDDTEILATVEE